MENFPEAISKTSAETIAEYFPTNEKYIREAEKLKEEKPPRRITPRQAPRHGGLFY